MKKKKLLFLIFSTKFEEKKKNDKKAKIKKIFYNLHNIWCIIKIFCQTCYIILLWHLLCFL